MPAKKCVARLLGNKSFLFGNAWCTMCTSKLLLVGIMHNITQACCGPVLTILTTFRKQLEIATKSEV